MSGQAVRPPHRRLLQTGWSFCGTEPGATAPPREDFRTISGPLPVAAALCELGSWSLDGPPWDFDAQDWWYRAEFDRPDAARVVLGFDGIATRADLWINGQTLGASGNMFVAQRFEVSDALRPGLNELLIRCRSLNAELAARRPRPRWRAPMIAHQQLRWHRTTLLGRTPGWSPPAAVVGPWRDIWLAEPSLGDGVRTRLAATVEGNDGHLHCQVDFDNEAASEIESALIELERGGKTHNQALARSSTSGRYDAHVHVRRVALWWPHTHGEPALYRARLRLRLRTGSEHVIELGPVGFRTLELDAASGAFRFRVNGVPVFCRGAGWTPLNPVSLRSTAQGCRNAVAQACAAGMNMLRVAGTTCYEEDHFYDTCDELGMLVWQDFMFANMDYPAGDPEFDATVMQEASQLLERLRSRPCLALLCGNSEVEQQASMWGAPRELWRPALFHDTLAQLCAQRAPLTPYWPSSAHGGAFPHQADAGTTSYYGVGAYLRPLEDARRSGLKFATECLAFANIPEDAALARMPGGLATRVHQPQWKARSPRDLGAGWDFDDVRDHYLASLFGMEPRTLRQTDHERYLALGRLATGEAMAAAYAEWRRPGSECGGALLLFLRDLWAGAGWGVVDDAGQPKACYHALRRTLQPLAVLLTDEGGNGLYAHVVSEHATERDVVLEVAGWRDGEIPVAKASRNISAPARGAVTIACADLFDHFIDLGWAWRFGPAPCSVVTATLRDADGGILSQAFHFPCGLNASQEIDVGLTAKLECRSAGEARLTLGTRRLALGVQIDVPGWEPRDNHFHLAPGSSISVPLKAQQPESLEGTVQAVNSRATVRVAATLSGSRDSGDKP